LPALHSVRIKIALTFLGAALAIAAFTFGVIRFQLQAVEDGAQLEAHNLARSVAYGATSATQDLQRYVQGLDDLYRRDIVIVDLAQRGIADAHVADLGRPYTRDEEDEVGRTIADGRPRTFIEKSARHPTGAREIAVPTHLGGDPKAPITGAVILEYTDIHAQLRDAMMSQVNAIAATGIVCVALVGLFGLRLANSISRRLRGLQAGVEQVAAGRYDVQLPPSPPDEIGTLTDAFNTMSRDLRQSRQRLLREVEKVGESARRIEHLAWHDRLTDLPNRARLSELLAGELARARRARRRVVLLLVDLDHFKNINDTLGHRVGDQLLKQIAARIADARRPGDVVARMGGDEFVVMQVEAPEAVEALAFAQRLLAALARPLEVDGQEFSVTASIGISAFPDDGEDEHTLMKNADIAMYCAKEDGRNNVVAYAPGLDKHSLERLAFESSLRRALDEQQFRILYQPKIDCGTGLATGVEALVRWEHPDLGLVAPAKFIPVAEEMGLIALIGRWVLRTGCAQQVRWRREGLGPLRMAVNLSARQFADDRLIEDIDAVLAETGIAPADLELEITESMLMRDLDRTASILAAIKARGIALSVDDFGTGYSSLSTLKRFPIDTIKIDRSFVRELPDDREDQAIIDAILALSRTLELTVVAEGVETAAQEDFLRTHGCDEIQGYFYCRPIEAATVPGYVARRAQDAAGR